MATAAFVVGFLAVGAAVAYALYRFSHLALARRGMRLVLGVYLTLMLVHAAAGMTSLGWSAPAVAMAFVSYLPQSLLALLS